MGFLDIFKSRKQKLEYAKLLSGNAPLFSQFGTDIYASDVVQQAINKIVSEVLKLRPKHIRYKGSDIVPIDDSIQRVLDNPNPLMSKSDFLEKITWLYMLNYNVFIYMERNARGELTGLFPLQPYQVNFMRNGRGRMFCEMYFGDGSKYTIPYDSFIHLKNHYSVNEVMGGDENGQPNNDALLKTLQLNNTLLEGVKKAMNSSFAMNGIVKYNTMMDDGKIEESIAEFEERLGRSESGFLGVDFKSEFIPLKRDLQLVDADTLKFVDEKILRHFGVSLCILTGDYTSEQYQAFYQSTLEPIVVKFSDGFTKGIFSERQIGFTNEIMFYPKELVFMSTDQTIQMINLLGQSGTLYENEKRVAFGYEPLPELEGVRMMSLNYVDVDIAKEYQLNGGTLPGADEKNEEGGEEDE